MDAESLSFDKILELFAETRLQMHETDRRMQESDRKLDKLFAETDRQRLESDRRLDKLREETDRLRQENDRRLDKLHEETDRQMQETGRKIDKLCMQVGGIDNNIGLHAEQFFQGIFAETLSFGGERYDCMLPNLRYSGRNSGVEFDIVLANGKSVAIIETKNRIHPDFVKELAEDKLVKFRKFFPHYQNHKVYLGIAGFSFNQAVTEQAKEYGVGIIKQVGKSVEMETEHLRAY